MKAFFTQPELYYVLMAFALVLSVFAGILGGGMHDTYGTPGTSSIPWMLSFAVYFLVPALVFFGLGRFFSKRQRQDSRKVRK